MPRGDGTGPDGNGPKSTNKGVPTRNGQGGSGARSGGSKGRGQGGAGGRIGGGRGRGICRRDGSCQTP